MLANLKKSFSFLSLLLLSLSLLFIVLVIRAKKYNLVDKEFIGKGIQILVISLWIIIYLLQFKALRNIFVFSSWLIIGFITFGMYLWLKNDPSLVYSGTSGDIHNYANGLRVPLVLLILFQTCRQISLKYYKKYIISEIYTKINILNI